MDLKHEAPVSASRNYFGDARVKESGSERERIMKTQSNNMSPFHFLSFAATECFTVTARQMNRPAFVARTNLRCPMWSHVWPLEVEPGEACLMVLFARSVFPSLTPERRSLT